MIEQFFLVIFIAILLINHSQQHSKIFCDCSWGCRKHGNHNKDIKKSTRSGSLQMLRDFERRARVDKIIVPSNYIIREKILIKVA